MSTPALPTANGHAALAYAVRGWPVLPLHTPTTAGCSCRRADCSHPGKHPRTRRGLRDATLSPPLIRAWWTRWPDANVAIATGELVVIDVDGPAAYQALGALEQRHGRLPTTLRARSARGEHIYFNVAGHDIGCSAGRFGPGLDVRGRGGYVVAPPSRHATGHAYAWTSTLAPVPIPPWLAGLLLRPARSSRLSLPLAIDELSGPRGRRYLQGAIAGEVARVATAGHRRRNDTLNRAAFRLGQLAAAGLGSLDELTEPLLDAALRAGLPESEAAKTIASGLSAGARQPRTPRATPGAQRAP
jgi:hypothetical protein